MNSRQSKPNEYERQPCCSRFGFRSRLQTIMEVDGSASRTPGGRERKQQNERGVKRPLGEMIGPAANNTNEDRSVKTSSQRGKLPARRCASDSFGHGIQPQSQPKPQSQSQAKPQQHGNSRPAKRSGVVATPSQTHDGQKRCKAEPLAACPADLPKRSMKSSQAAPSVGGVPKLIRNHVKPVTDDQRAMHKQLQIEHLQLQRSFALWRQLVEEARSHQDNEELASWAEEKEGILKSTKKLQDKVDELQEKLTEYREQNELLEFRILELDHCQTKQQQCPPCGEAMTSPQPGFCSTGCSRPEDPCCRLFQDQITLYQDLEFRADELLEELRLLSALPGLSCTQRSALARSAACVARCKGEARSTIGLLSAPDQLQQTTASDQAQFLGSEWLGKILFGGGGFRSSGDKVMDEDDADLSDQSLLQETSMTESEIGQALISEWPLPESHPKTTEQQHSEDEGLGEDSRRSTEPNSLVSEETDAKTLQSLVEDLRKKNSTLRSELRQAEVLVRTLKIQADRVLELETQLTRTERERSEYQEQILELEEAENDARLESQTLRALVDNLRQHEDDLQKSLCATRDRLEECEQRASSAGTTAEELRSQVGYLEELVYKYEEHIEGLERAETELHRKLRETKKDCADVEVQVDEAKKIVSDVSVQVEVEDALCRCPQKKDLLARLQSLEERDGVLREQLHQVDGINLKLWQKLYCLETDIGECKRQEGSWGPEQHHREAAARLEGLLGAGSTSKLTTANSPKEDVGDSEEEIGDRLLTLECNEKKLREQLLQLERINQDFERELEIRERLNRDKEREQTQWIERERELKGAIAELEVERVSLREQTQQLEEERATLRDSLEHLQEEYGRLKLAHCQETQDLHVRHQEASQGLQDTRGQEEEDFQKVMRLSQEALQLKSEQEELRSQVAEMSLAFETELRALRACHELEEKRLHDEMMALRCRDDQCCSRVQELAVQRERLECTLAERERQLEELTGEFQKKSQALEEERRLVENELQRKMREMEESTADAVQELEEKRKQLETSLRADMEDLRCKENSYKMRIRELERHVDSLRNEITSLAQGVGGEDYGSEEHQEYRHKIEELEKKEAAYVETLQNADKIISQMELRYRDNIQRLEGSERSLQERIVQLENTESELRSALHNERRSSDSGRIVDLVRELVEAETRENSLKEHADELEASHKALLQRVRELEKTNQQISEELDDHEETSQAAGDLRLERERLKEEIGHLKRSEAALQETLTHADAILAQRERLLEARVNELVAEKQDSDEMVKQLREQVRSMQEQLDHAQLHQAPPSPRENADTEVSREEISDLKLEVLELEKLIRRSSWSFGETKETQTERTYYCSSRSATVPVSPASSLEDLSAYPQQAVPAERAEDQDEAMMIRDGLEDGIQERMQLELCMKRAMAAMERDLQRKSDPQQKPQLRGRLPQVFRREEEEDEDEEEEEEERIRMPPSPACSSTSGCESDCSSSGGSTCRWPDTGRGQSAPAGQADPYASDEEQPHIERLTVTSKELPTLMKTRIIYPSITKTEVKEMPTLVTRHSEYPVDDTTLEDDQSLPEAPSDFCILRHVGRDSLLLGWTPPTSNITSYQILVDGEVHQRVRSPDRTKALLHKLDLTRPMTIAIRSLVTASQREDLLSRPALLRYQPTECHNQ